MQPRRMPPWRGLALALTLATVTAAQAEAQRAVTSPKEEFGFNIGDDYHLVNYTQLEAYWKKLASQSDRMVLREMGKTAEGRTQWAAIITSPENQKKLEQYRQTAEKLALATGLTDEEARKLAEDGKAVVWIDGGLHATEVLGSQQLIETVYELVSRTDPETMRILSDVIIVAVPANPDGLQLVADWYNREPVLEKRSTAGVPRLYQKYIGHDNNRDFYMSAQPETKNMNRLMYRTWYPQIVYNHHQTGPLGTVIFSPPFRDPFNFNIDPMVVEGIDMVGAAMHTRYLEEGLPGFTMRSGSSYSTWWNGGLRTEAYFHNMIGILTETIGNPTPINIPFIPKKQLPTGDLPAPIEPQQVWHFAQSLKYAIAGNYAILDLASRYRSKFLYNIYLMGKRSIERGSEDSWTASPKKIAAAEAALGMKAAPSDNPDYFDRNPDTAAFNQFASVLRRPEDRDPKGYILPADQPDFATATKFVNAFLDNGIEVQRATAAFDVAGKHYPAGSYVIKTAQAFRPHVLDMFEPQDHPNDIPYPGAAPKPPYDNAGYTLAVQMGVKFDRVLDAFDGPFEPIQGVDIKAPAGKVVAASSPKGYLFSHEMNDAFVAVNRLLAAKREVYWLKEPQTVGEKTWAAGTFYVPAAAGVQSILEKVAAEKGVSFQGVAAKPKGDAVKLKPVRIGLWDQYGGSMPSGWTRWLFEQYEFPYRVVYPKELDAGNLNSKYDVLVFVTGGIPGGPGNGRRGGFNENLEKLNIPDSLKSRLGRVTAETTVPQLKAFLEKGGTVITEGSSTALARHLGLPVGDALSEAVDGKERHLPSSKFYIPGSILQARLDLASPLAAGMTDPVNVFYDNSPAFKLGDDAAKQGVKSIAWFDTDTPLVSGWAWGQEKLKGAVEVAEAKVGKGELYLFAPEVTFRGQPHGTFRFLFNGILYGPASGN
ncbi:MAG TPA: M14 metallopeptidase family protein [Longimicrobiales bacterium]|nr:M14 metallopeptidase family protein [Longimicrobiales bacterium]